MGMNHGHHDHDRFAQIVPALPVDAGAIWSIEPTRFSAMVNILRANGAHIKAQQQRQRRSGGDLFRRSGKVALIEIKGVMLKGAGALADLFNVTDTATATRAVQQAAGDDHVKAIMLVIDSPGGSVAGLAELGDAIFEARRHKLVVAQSDGMIASAAFYAASQATIIAAHRMDLVGSLGARLVLYDLSVAFEREGIEPVVLDTSPEDRPFKSAGTLGTPITPAQRQDFQRVVNAFGDDFRAILRRGRRLDEQDIERVFTGSVWIADPEGAGLGLVDRIATLEQTFDRARGEAEGRPRLQAARELEWA